MTSSVETDVPNSSVITVTFDQESAISVVDEVRGDIDEIVDHIEVVEIDMGVEGPVGPRGPQGPQGVAPTVMTDVENVSSVLLAHTFTYPPDVRLIRSDGVYERIGPSYPDDTHVALNFPDPFTGKIILS